MIISASKERADNMSIFLQKLIIETPWLSHLRPKWRRCKVVEGKLRCECSPHQAPSVKSVGITGQLTGSRADLMILDDIEVPGNSMTELMREKLLQLCTEAESILHSKEDSRIMYLGTPQTTFTIYRKLAERSYKPFVWTARYPRDQSKYEGLLAPQLEQDMEEGSQPWDVTDDRFDNEDLIEREASMGRSNFMLQFMLDTSLSDAEKFPLKCADLSSQVSTPVLPLNQSCGVVTHPMLLKNYQLSDYLEIISTVQCNSKELEPLHRDNLLDWPVGSRHRWDSSSLYLPTKRFPVPARNACLQRRILRQHAPGHSKRM